MVEHLFSATISWPGGRDAVGQIQCGQLRAQVSVPAQMNGPGTGTNPDEMLVSAAATCYIITLAAMLERAGIRTAEMHLQSDGIVDVTRGVFSFRRITHRPRIRLADGNPPDAMQALERLVRHADRSCMISKALRGNVEIVLEPELLPA